MALAKHFELLIRDDERFEIPAKRHLGMVVFRLKGQNELTENLLKRLNSTGLMHAVPASLKDKYVIRFTVTSPRTTVEDVERDWNIIQTIANDSTPKGKERVKLKGKKVAVMLLLSMIAKQLPFRHQGTKPSFRNEPAPRKHRAEHGHDTEIH